MSKNEEPWVSWTRWADIRSEEDRDDYVKIGEVALNSIHREHRHFDIKNSTGAILLGCRIDTAFEDEMSGGEPSFPVTTVNLVAVTSDSWKIKIDDKTLLRRSRGSAAKEQATRAAEKKRDLNDRKKELAKVDRDIKTT